MLYVIDESVADHFASGKALPADVTGINYLTMGVAEGSHRIGGFRKTLQTLARARQACPGTEPNKCLRGRRIAPLRKAGLEHSLAHME